MFARRQFLATALTASALAPPGAPARAAAVGLDLRGRARLAGIEAASGGSVLVEPTAERDVSVLRLRPGGLGRLAASDELAITVAALPQLVEAVQIWRYKPWNAWTKPMHVASFEDLQQDDVQLLYWS